MNEQKEVAYLLQSLRGAQPMIILAYLLIRRAMTIDELETAMHKDDKKTARKKVNSTARVVSIRTEGAEEKKPTTTQNSPKKSKNKKAKKRRR